MYRNRPLHRRACAVLGALVVALATLVLGASPASAASYPNEQAMVNEGDDDKRDSFVVDPGQGHRLTRAQVIANRHIYTGVGRFTDNFLWYSHETTRSAAGDRGWAFCRRPPGSNGGSCPTWGIGLTGNRIVDTFGGGVDLPAFWFDDDFIARACGNFNTDSDKAVPVPRIVGDKFHDLNRNGARDGGEPGIAGWQFRIVRQSSLFGDQDPGEWDVATDAGGRFRFDLLGHGPGVYTVEEHVRPGWTETTAPGRRTVVVGDGIGNDELYAGAWGNVENETDVVKVSMSVVNPPVETMVDTDTPVVVRSVVANRGPAGPIDVDETLVASGLPDCTITPATQRVRLTMARGETRTIDSTVVVRCSQPSFHPFTFVNRLDVVTPGVTDVEPANNTATTSTTIAVIAHADLGVRGVALTCPPRADKDASFRCTLAGEVVNAGPFGPADAVTEVALTGPADCAFVPDGPVMGTTGPIEAGGAAPVSASWTVTCAQRSFHPLTGSLAVRPVDQHVLDLDASDDVTAAGVTVPVFEPADLAVENATLVCDEVWNGDPFTCVLETRVSNLGPADAVQAEVAIGLDRSPECTTTPGREATTPLILGTGERRVLRYEWTVACPIDPLVHDFRATVTIAAAEPHAEDLHAGNDRRVIHWQPSDLKPDSDPNTLNLRREGVTSVAILGTAGFDPIAEIDVRTLSYGATGAEDSLVRCATELEDVNGDGLGDLTCKFAVARTGFVIGEQLGLLTGLLIDGTPFMSADIVRVVHA